jgi:hypothetical protein
MSLDEHLFNYLEYHCMGGDPAFNRMAFYAGAAAMAEIFATHSAPVQDLVRTLLRQQMTDAALLRETVAELANQDKTKDDLQQFGTPEEDHS